MDLFEELQRVPFFTNQEATSGSQGVFLVMIEMILALIGIILNLTVLIRCGYMHSTFFPLFSLSKGAGVLSEKSACTTNLQIGVEKPSQSKNKLDSKTRCYNLPAATKGF